MVQYRTTLPVEEAGVRIEKNLLQRDTATKCVDRYHTISLEKESVMCLVFEKSFAGNTMRSSLTVLINDLPGYTEVRAVGAGGVDSNVPGFIEGCSGGDFETEVYSALRGTVIR